MLGPKTAIMAPASDNDLDRLHRFVSELIMMRCKTMLCERIPDA